MRNELFVNTINNFVFLGKPFITWKPPLVKDGPGFLVRQAISPARGTGWLRAVQGPENRHTHLFLFEDKLTVTWGAGGVASRSTVLQRAPDKKPLRNGENALLKSLCRGTLPGALLGRVRGL